jgi:hypothetical protein
MEMDARGPGLRMRRGVVGKPQVSRLHNIGGSWASQGLEGWEGEGVPPPPVLRRVRKWLRGNELAEG